MSVYTIYLRYILYIKLKIYSTWTTTAVAKHFLLARITKNYTILTPKFDIPKYVVPLKFQTDKVYQRHNFRCDNANVVNAFN